jgi:hypothetical protein
VHNKLQYRREEMNYEQVEVIVPDGDFGCWPDSLGRCIAFSDDGSY